MVLRVHFPICACFGLAVVGCADAPKPVYPAKKSNAIVAGARDQLTWGTLYDARYTQIAYPGGDVPKTRGVCTDVVIRAFRHAGYDLQVLVHEDKLRPGSGYPKYGDSARVDSNIDHRRCPNLQRFLERHGDTLSKETDATGIGEWKPGDIVFWTMNDGKDHVGIVSDIKTPDGRPYVIHNSGVVAEDDALHRWRIVGHFRYPKGGIEAALPRKAEVR
jgi:uncharacterized protein YijF (DUF1287 family)